MDVIETDQMVWRISSPPKPIFGVDLEALEPLVLSHLKSAREAAERAYAPFSEFKVGASVEALDGQEKSRAFSGCNVENASYGATMCAERVALFSAVAAGYQKFRLLVLTTPATANEADPSLRSPCGLCRQVMSEFFDEHTIILIDGGNDEIGRDCVDFTNIDFVLPWRFQL